MKTRKLLAFLLLVSLIFSCMGMTAQAASKMEVIHAYTSTRNAEMYVALRAGSTGTVPSNVKFYAADGEELPIIDNDLPNGHILVVDRSEYFSRHITARHVGQIAKTYLQLLPQDDLVKIIFADAPAQGTDYMPLNSAINYMNTLTAFSTSSPLLSTAINNAIMEAASQEEGDPVCKTIAVVANPSQASQNSAFAVNSANAKSVVYMTVMVPTRAMYETSSNAGYAAYKAGRSNLNALATQMGGSYFEVPETGDVTANGNDSFTSVDTSAISAASAYLNSTRSFLVDISHLSELARQKKGEEVFSIQMKSQGSNLGDIKVTVPISILPTPKPTAKPTQSGPTPEPTATPIPIVIKRGDNGIEFRKAIYALIQNYYLREDYLRDTSGNDEKAFDDEAQVAYDLFCEKNNLPMTDGISAPGYFFLTDPDAKKDIVPNPTATPAPTEAPTTTPVPIYPQQDLRMGDKDADLPSNYIQKIQAQLQALNCYISEDGPQVYTPGVFDQATMNAVNTYCKNFNVANTVSYGASKQLCEDILTVKRNPIVTPTPTPTPVVTPTPAPTIPAVGYTVGDTDEKIPGGFIQALQTRLQALNCYATADGMLTPTLGVFDDATMQAINAYCETYSVNNTVVNGVSASICQDILNSERPIRETPTVSLSEKIKEFLMRPLFALGTFQVIMWMALVLCAVLVVGIIIVIVLMKSGDDNDLSKSSERISRTPASGQNPDEYNQLVTRPQQQPMYFDSDKTMPEGVGSTIPEGFGMPISLRIEYLDRVRNESPIISSAFTIGRRDCALLLDPGDKSASSKHAMLYTENGQLFIRDLDSTNGTYVNGNRISKMKDMQASLSDKTMILDEQDPQDRGYMLNRGDVIRMGKHHITVHW